MNAQLERTRRNVVDQIALHKNIRDGIIRKYEQDKAREDGALDVLFEVMNDIDKQLAKDGAAGPQLIPA
jgi:hypothetical protein